MVRETKRPTPGTCMDSGLQVCWLQMGPATADNLSRRSWVQGPPQWMSVSWVLLSAKGNCIMELNRHRNQPEVA